MLTYSSGNKSRYSLEVRNNMMLWLPCSGHCDHPALIKTECQFVFGFFPHDRPRPVLWIIFRYFQSSWLAHFHKLTEIDQYTCLTEMSSPLPR